MQVSIYRTGRKQPHFPTFRTFLKNPGLPFGDASITSSPRAGGVVAVGNAFTMVNPSGETMGPDRQSAPLNPVLALGAFCANRLDICGWPTRFAGSMAKSSGNGRPVGVIEEATAVGFLILCGHNDGKPVFSPPGQLFAMNLWLINSYWRAQFLILEATRTH